MPSWMIFVNHGNLSFQNFSKYASFLLIPVEYFLVLSERFSPFSSNNLKREKTRGRRENFFRMKKRLPNLSSAIILLLLSYLAQSPTGRCQSGRMSTPGKCVYLSAINFPPQYIRNGYIAVFVCRSMGKILGKRVILLLLSPSEILQEVLTMRNPKA